MLEVESIFNSKGGVHKSDVAEVTPPPPKLRGHIQAKGCIKCKKLKRWVRSRGSSDLHRHKCKGKKSLRTKPEAPFNSTQFIMDEHDTLNDSDLSTSWLRRHRDSSFSHESEDPDDYDVSSTEEEEFSTQQFWFAYEEFNAERLDAMSKSQLIQEYFALEERLTFFEKELLEARERDRQRIREPSPVDDDDEDGETIPGEVPVDAETAAKIEIFRAEIQKLEIENERLRQENACLRSTSCRCSRSSSSSSSSSSAATSNGRFSDSEENLDRTSPLVDLVNPQTKLSASQLKLSRFRDSDSGIATSEGISSGDDLRIEETLRHNSIEDDLNLSTKM